LTRLRLFPQIYYGWIVIAAMFVVAMYVGGVVFYGFTAIVEPISVELAWPIWVITLAASIRGVESSVLAPMVGTMVDRFGPRRLMFGGLFFSFAGIVLLSQTHGLPSYFAAFILITLGTSTTNMTVVLTVVGSWFRRRLGLANGIAVSGFAAGGLLVPVLNAVIESYNWRVAMLAMAVGLVLMVIPLIYFVRMPDASHPRDEAEFSLGGAAGGSAAATIPEADSGVKQALRSRVFWHLAVAYISFALVIVSVITHIMPYLMNVGMTRFHAGWVAMAMPLASIAGRLGLGWLADRWQPRRVILLAFLMVAIGIFFFGLAQNQLNWLVPFLLVFTIGYGGAIALRPLLVREYFGRAHFGTIFGFLMAASMIGGVIGPPLAGWVFDATGKYQSIWFIYAGLVLVAYLAILTCPRIRSGTRPRS
jgi:MFS family permease